MSTDGRLVPVSELQPGHRVRWVNDGRGLRTERGPSGDLGTIENVAEHDGLVTARVMFDDHGPIVCSVSSIGAWVLNPDG